MPQTIHTLPGSDPYPKELTSAFDQMKLKRGTQYKPRTKHLVDDKTAKYTNRLFLESSPYLLQHAHNPVNWYPWSDEAFEVAKRLDQPIFLSIGYSTCHWCHVMEEESFEDEEVAEYLNRNYVAIKVDREERPDVDAIYMAAVQALTGSGGWPMSVWMTAERKPFWGGTYFPARDGDRGVQMGFLSIVKQLSLVFSQQRDKIQAQSSELAGHISQMLSKQAPAGDLPTAAVLFNAFNQYQSRSDRDHGGILGAPKFPSSLPVRFLARFYRRTKEKDALDILSFALKKMASGGMYDHVGGGFHRYSVDEQWLVPHFEKMLYDNALLVMSYLDGYQVTDNPDFKRVVDETLHYIKRDMTSPDGAFYSATDADSLTPEGHRDEGYFFTWTSRELDEVLGVERSKIIKSYFFVSKKGNFEGRNILHTPEERSHIAKELSISVKKLDEVIQSARHDLYQARLSRPQPIRDEKILTAWNGLMISAYARAGLVLGNSEYVSQATRAAEFIRDHLYQGERLYRTYKDGELKYLAYLDDYAFYIAGLLDLYEAGMDQRWLKLAIELDGVLEKRFEDQKQGGFFMTSCEHETLLVREKPSYDGAEPSGNSVALHNLLRLHHYTFNKNYMRRAERSLKAFQPVLNKNPGALSEMLLSLDSFLDRPKEIILTHREVDKDQVDVFLKAYRKVFIPNSLLVIRNIDKPDPEVEKLLPFLKDKKGRDGKVTAYVCEQGICQLPTSDPEVFSAQLQTVLPLLRP